jgi:hypothetical protein
MARNALFYERYAEASLLNDASLIPGNDPEAGLDDLFLVDLAIAGPASEEDSTGRAQPMFPPVRSLSPMNWALLLGSTER